MDNKVEPQRKIGVQIVENLMIQITSGYLEENQLKWFSEIPISLNYFEIWEN